MKGAIALRPSNCRWSLAGISR